MEFGIQFFPDVGPEEKSAQDYWNESLYLSELGDQLGYGHVRTVEHYFHRYGGYSTNPIVFLAAASQRTKKMALITGAVLPIFNNPLKLAGEIGMVDAMSKAGSKSASRAPSCRMSSRSSAARWTRAARASTKASSRSACCWSRRTSPATANSTASTT